MRAISEVAQGSLLVADPGMGDPNFRRAVVLVLHHSEDGTLGVVLNRPSEVPVGEVLPAWSACATEPASVFVGGPVERSTPLCLAALQNGENPAEVPGTIGVRGTVALVVLDSDPGELASRLRGLRVFAGYAGWGEGQLAAELDRGDWLVARAAPEDIIAGPGTDLWGEVLRRQGVPTALLATHPGDPGRN